jgi:thiamine-monophosphate kinase
MTDLVTENRLIESLTKKFQRSPMQINGLQEADAEIIRFGSAEANYLAATTDSIVEEINTGLYGDPYLIGWMAVMVNMSDLAAVGAHPLGILISETLPPNLSEEWVARLQEGIEEACEACGSFVLGGDTNAGKSLCMTGCAIGITAPSALLTRIGAKPGDTLYASGPLGIGNAFALQRYLPPRDSLPREIHYRPCARIVEGGSIAGIATSCMDTSDGALATLDQLARLNGVGFELEPDVDSLLDTRARCAAIDAGIAPWLLLAGHHGEFELLFTTPAWKETALLETAERSGWQPIRIGHAIPESAIRLTLYGNQVDVDTASIRNLAVSCSDNIEKYIQELLFIDEHYRKGVFSHVNS